MPMSSSSNGTSLTCKLKVEGELVGEMSIYSNLYMHPVGLKHMTSLPYCVAMRGGGEFELELML
jgi:hypothetical protein